jgi:hypothetical protein
MFWPWWLGGAALGGLALAYWFAERRLLGVSGQVTGILDAVEHPEDERKAAAMARVDEAALLGALEAATAEAAGSAAASGTERPATSARVPARPRTLHVAALARAMFLIALVLGGTVSAALAGDLAVRDLGDGARRFLGEGPGAILLLLGGGVMVGFGTRMAGGCTSGHGLCGSSRLQPGSLLSTATFFGVGIAFSYLMEWLVR